MKNEGKTDDCLEVIKDRMNKILKMKARKQNMKINLNIDPFKEELKKLMESLNLPDSEINKILAALKIGTMRQGNVIGLVIKFLRIIKFFRKPKRFDLGGTQDQQSYDKSCPNCKVNSS